MYPAQPARLRRDGEIRPGPRLRVQSNAVQRGWLPAVRDPRRAGRALAKRQGPWRQGSEGPTRSGGQATSRRRRDQSDQNADARHAPGCDA